MLDKLNDKEKEIALEILKNLKEGDTSSYNELINADYREIPVDIITFVKDPNYLGNAWHLADGTCTLYPFWEEKLKELFPDPYTTNFNTAIFSGARGLGKSEIAITCGLYMMYRLMCLKNPYDYLALKPTEKVCFAFMNIKLELAEEIGISKLQNTVKMSPWFMSRGVMTGQRKDYWNPPDWIHIIIGSQSNHVIGQPIYWAFFDEISFVRHIDVDKQKAIAINMVDTALGGMKTRFIRNGINPTLLILGSSKRSEKSFLETHIKKKQETDKENTFIVEDAVWNVKPKGTYKTTTFKVAVGNKYLTSLVLEEDADINSYINKGYRIIEVPDDFKTNFLEDIDRALCDYAGISSTDLSTFISGARVAEIEDVSIKNPFEKDVIEVGNDPKDTSEYWNYFDLNEVLFKEKPMYIHIDTSLTGDKTGLAGVVITGKDASTQELRYQVSFGVSIKAPKGYQVSFEKTRKFIYWLKDQGFNIKGISSDTFQSADLKQTLLSKGFNYKIISVDRTDSNHVCVPYQLLKTAIYEKRLIIPAGLNLLKQEWVALEKNTNTGKVDHPTNGCFTGETKVRLVDGRTLSFFELVNEFNVGKENWVYSINKDTLKIEPKKIKKAWLTNKDQPIIRIWLDNNSYVDCTYNHKFMLRDGTYKEAKVLQSGDSLMPLYTKYPTNGGLKNKYRMYYEPIENLWHYEHRQFATEIADEKYLVHHKNFNPGDNTPTNLIWCSKAKHIEYHSKSNTGAYSEEAQRKRAESVHMYHLKNKDTEAYRDRNKKLSLAAQTASGQLKKKERKEYIQSIESYFDICWEDLSSIERNSYAQKYQRYLHSETIEKIAGKIRVNHKLGLYKNASIALSNYNALSKELKNKFPSVNEEEFYQFFGFNYNLLSNRQKAPWINKYRHKKYSLLNHKVLRIEYLQQCKDVYDLEIEDNHNFALDCGVFVHNSKDISDAVCGALYHASLNSEEYSYNFGDDYDVFSNINNKTEEQKVLDKEKNFINSTQSYKQQDAYSQAILGKQELNRPDVFAGDGMIAW